MANRQTDSGYGGHHPPSYRDDMNRGFDSSRAVADDYQGIHRGFAYHDAENTYAHDAPPDTPSMYTDPYEYASTAVGHNTYRGKGPRANIIGTRPDANFLDQDPYPSQPYHANVSRSNTTATLEPHDSISAYNVDVRSRNLGMSGSYDSDGALYDPNQSRDFDTRHHNRYESSASMPLKDNADYMAYADDEEDENRKRDHYWNHYGRDAYDNRHPPSLFANNLQGFPAQHFSVDGNEENKRGLLSKLTGSHGKGLVRPGWGGTVQEQIERRRKGVGRQRWPILSWIFAVVYVIVFIVELIKSKAVTGQAIQTKPSINPMIGPPSEFLISFGARFVPCMRNVPDVPLTTPLICLKDSALSSVSSDQTCPLYQICGLPNANTHNQSYRFITPIFIHAGFVHIAFNLLAQLTLGSQIEKIFSSPVYLIAYVLGGLGGNLLGGNFGLVGLPSVGASGAIYALISLELTDLLYNWRYEYRPVVRLMASIIFTIIGFAIGLLPGLDNFAHIGGFAVGILCGATLGPSIHETRRHRVVTWCVRVIACGLLIGFFVGLATNFYNAENPNEACRWCRYLSCLPTFSQCKGNGLNVSSSSSSSSSSNSSNF